MYIESVKTYEMKCNNNKSLLQNFLADRDEERAAGLIEQRLANCTDKRLEKSNVTILPRKQYKKCTHEQIQITIQITFSFPFDP